MSATQAPVMAGERTNTFKWTISEDGKVLTRTIIATGETKAYPSDMALFPAEMIQEEVFPFALKQKLANDTAGVKGTSAKTQGMDDIYARLLTGEWTQGRARGEGGLPTTDLTEALGLWRQPKPEGGQHEPRGLDYAKEKMAQWKATLSPEDFKAKKAYYRGLPAIKAILADIAAKRARELAKAAKGAPATPPSAQDDF